MKEWKAPVLPMREEWEASVISMMEKRPEDKSRKEMPTDRLAMWSERLFLLLMTIYLLKASLATTLFRLPWPEQMDHFLRLAICAVVLLKTGYHPLYTDRRWLAGILVGIAFGMSWLSTGYSFLLDIPLLMLGAMGIPGHKILKLHFWTGAITLSLALLGSATGTLRDLIYEQNGFFKHSFGIVYPTDFAARVVYLALLGWVLYPQLSLKWKLTGVSVLSVIIYCFCRAKNSTIVLCCLLIGIIYEEWTHKSSFQSSAGGKICRKLEHGLYLGMPVLAVLMLILTKLYDPEIQWIARINHFLSNRLLLGRQMLVKYGVTAFGTPFDLIGNGGENAYRWDAYNFVDSSYELIAIRYGWVLLTTLCLLYLWGIHQALKRGNRKVALALGLIALHSLMEHHLLEITYNGFLLLPWTQWKNRNHVPAKKGIQGKKWNFLFAGMTVFILIGAARVTLWYLRTAAHVLQTDTSTDQTLWLIILFTFLLLIFWFLRTSWILAVALSQKQAFLLKGWRKQSIFVSGCLLLILLCANTLRQGQDAYRETLEAEQPVLDLLLEHKDTFEKLYIDDIPALYTGVFDGISTPFFREDGIADEENIVLVTCRDRELQRLICTGYSFGELSQLHGIYTNSESARKLLEQAGIPMTDYYSASLKVDLQETAKANDLEFTEDGGLRIAGNAQSIWHGPWVTVCTGKIKVRYVIRFLETQTPENMAYLRISGQCGQYFLSDVILTAADFDSSGRACIELEATIPFNMEDVEFFLLSQEGTEFIVEEISWTKTG